MQQTTNYQLSQWESSDRILREDFNADNAKIDAALAEVAASGIRFVTGTYTGTGTFGSAAPKTLTFDGKPLLLVISGSYGMVATYGAPKGFINSNASTTLTWTENSVTWYSSMNEGFQMNSSGVVYTYAALVQ